MTSIDVYQGTVCNSEIIRNILEGKAKEYPEYQDGVLPIRQMLLLEENILTGSAVIATDEEGNQGFCVYFLQEDPHVSGMCLIMQITLSNSVACTKAIMKHLFKEAYAGNCAYIWISRRTGARSYQGTFHKLRKR